MQHKRSLDEILSVLRPHMPVLRHRFRVQRLEVFGSYVRGDATEESDLDVLVEFDETPSLIGFMKLQNHLSDLLGIPVDLGMTDAVRGRIGQRILREKITV